MASIHTDVEGVLDAARHDVEAWRMRVALGLPYLDNQVDVSRYAMPCRTGQRLNEAARELRVASRRLDQDGRLRVRQGPDQG